MMRKHIITIAGNLGSGKSFASSKVAEILGYQKKSTGDFFRDMAKERGITTLELNQLAYSDPSIDKAVDDSTIELGKKENNIVIDSRLAFHFIPDSFKVFLKCDPQSAALRIQKDKDTSNRLNETNDKYETVEDIALAIIHRSNVEKQRYFEKYGIKDITDLSQFDFVIDTALPENNKERVPEIIIEAYKKWLEQ